MSTSNPSSLAPPDSDSDRAGAPEKEPARPRPIVPLLDYQRRDVESDARFTWNCWARQTGKSFTKSLRRILRGLARRRTQILLSAGERQSRELMLKVRQHCQALKIACDFYDDRIFRGLTIKSLEVILPGGVRIVGLPANPQTVRGYTGDVFLDEFAMHAFDREIWAAIFPSILRGHGELDVASTPKGKGNVFCQLRDNPLFSTSVVTLPDAIAQGLDVDLEAMRKAMGDEELFRQEFLCEFLDEATAFLTYEQIDACIDPQRTLCATITELADETRDLYVGVDIGRLRDLTVIWILARDGERLPTVGVWELAHAPFREQFERIAGVLSLRHVRRCCIDAGGIGMQLAEECVERFGPRRVERVTFGASVKSEMATALRIAVENGSIRIPDDDRIRRDWHSVERSVTETGHFRLAAPRVEGSHADRFWAAALAVRAAGIRSVAAPECLSVAPMQFARKGTW